MKALEQNYRTGKLRVVDVPEPKASPGRVAVRTEASLASVGTEKGMMELARKNLVGKALARPDLVKQVVDKLRTDGISETWRQVMGRLDTPVLLGYSSAGTVTDAGPESSGFATGDRVACAGSGFAGHVEATTVPVNLCCKIPNGVTFEEASFVAIGGIALEAVRMARVGLGERVVVIGLGLLGQIAVQLLRSAGCHVFGVDLDAGKARLAIEYGAEDISLETDTDATARVVSSWSNGHGADAVIILAATPSNGPIELAAEVCRERGRVVATGLVGLEVPRRSFYEKELELVVSRAWGPGLYDPQYAEGGRDYPQAYARWTAKRNMEEFLAQISVGSVSVKHLITHRFPIEKATDAYEMIFTGAEPHIGVVIEYPKVDADSRDHGSTQGATSGIPSIPTSIVLLNGHRSDGSTQAEGKGIGIIGAGQFAQGTLLPALSSIKNVNLRGVATSTGFSGHHTAEKYGFDYCTTDYKELLADKSIDAVMVLTRHGAHSKIAVEALAAGKHVFVEKPLAINVEQLHEVAKAFGEAQIANPEGKGRPRVLMVGFNRRFSPSATWLKERISKITDPLAINCVVNAGAAPIDSWVNDPVQGGGRIIGEVCHFVDLVSYLASSTPARVYVERIGSTSPADDDSIAATITLVNGSIGTIHYAAGGHKRYARERVEVYGGGAVGVIDNFKSASFYQGSRKEHRKSRFSVDRGHRGEMEAFVSAVEGSAAPPVDLGDYIATTLATFAMERSITTGLPERLDLEGTVRGATV